MAKSYHRGMQYAYMITYSYNPLPMSPGTSKIASAWGTVTLTQNKSAIEMMEMLIGYVKENAGLPSGTVIFPSLYHVEEN